MRFYGLSFREIENLHILTFLMLSRNVDRLEASEAYSLAILFAQATAGEKFGDYLDDLRSRIGSVVEYEETKVPDGKTVLSAELDRDGLAELKLMSGVL